MGRCRIVLLILFSLTIYRSFANDRTDEDTSSVENSGKYLLFPFFLKSPETIWGFGAAAAYLFKPEKDEEEVRTSDLNIVALYTLRRQVVFVLGSTVFFSMERTILRFQSSYSYYPDKCWGIGNATLTNAVEEFSIKQVYFNPQLLKKIVNHWYAGISYEYQHIENFIYQSNGVFDRQNIIGRNGGNTVGAGFLLTWDMRNNAYSPTKGYFFELSAKRFDHKFGGNFNFNAFTVDFRSFTKLWKDQVFAFHFIMKDNGGSVPIRNLSMLGGSEIMRGYYQGRFMDMDMVAVQAELRQFLFWRIGITGFGALGEVAPKTSDYSLSGFHHSYGAGLRFMVSKSEKLNLRIDYGIGKNSNGLYVILKEAF